jgi:MFS family permease
VDPSQDKPPQQDRLSLTTTFRALRHRNFQLFFSGQLISLIGTWMQSIAQAWLVYRLTGSSLLLGSVGFAGQFPVFLAAPLGGIVADRYNRQRVVIGTQIASMVLALVLAILTLSNKITVPEIFWLAALLGVVNAFDIPGRQAFLVEMVGKDDLINAIALNSSMFNGARIIGPAIAGLLVARIGEGWCFFANAVSYIAVIIGLFLMRVPPREHRPQGSPLAHIIEGFRFVRNTAPIRAILLLLGRADAGVCGQSFAWGRARAGYPDGRDRGRRAAWRPHAGHSHRRLRLRPLDYVFLRRLRHNPGGLQFLAPFLALHRAAGPGGILHDVADVVLQHADPGHGAGRSSRPRDVGLLHDVYGHGAVRSAARRRAG